MGAGGFHHVRQHVPVLQDGAGAQQVVVERLPLVVLHEDRRFQGIEQRRLAYVRVGVVREHARLHVAGGVDMQIASSAGDASAHELAIVLEVEGEQRFLAAHLADEAVEAFALVGLHHEFDGRVHAYGHVGEYPGE